MIYVKKLLYFQVITISFMHGQRVQGAENEAIVYLKHFKRYWGKTEGAINWVQNWAPKLENELKQKQNAKSTAGIPTEKKIGSIF